MFGLLAKRKFAPFFATMGLGAFNDNLYKSSLAILIAYSLPPKQADIYVQLSAGLFILPFFLISGISGQICDKYDKGLLMRRIKVLEIFIMALGALGFYFNNVPFLMAVLFLMGAQSTLFGPVKYSILPQHLEAKELLAGNSLTSGGTFISILIGTIIGGMLVTKDVLSQYSYVPIAAGVVVTAIIGTLFSWFIPHAKPADASLKINWNPLTETIKTLKISRINKNVFWSIIGISWFWFFGFFFMASLPSYARDMLKANEASATILLTMISIGMGLGSLFCEKISAGETKLGLVTIGSVALSLFGIDLYLIGPTFTDSTLGFLGLKEFFSNPTHFRVAFDLLMIGLSGGVFIVPLYTNIQIQTPREYGSRVIASNNIINAIFMVSAAAFAIVCFSVGLSILQIFLIVSLLNLVIGISTFFIMPPHFYLVFFSIMMRVIYRFKVKGVENIPRSGGAIIAANHVSFIDPLIIAGSLPRPPRFIMDKAYYDIKALQWFFTQTKSIPITPKKIDPKLMEEALETAAQYLREGHLLTVYPEGFITKTGEMIEFKDGVKRITEKVDVPIVPVAIKGMWGSWFSRVKGSAMKGLPPNRFWAKVEVEIGKPYDAKTVSMKTLQDEVARMRGDML